MSIPLATTTVTFKRIATVDPDAAGYDPAPGAPVVVATGVRASITVPSGRVAEPQQADTYAFRCDPVEGVDRFCTVVDETDNREYDIIELVPSLPLTWGLEHIRGTIQRSKGIPDGQ